MNTIKNIIENLKSGDLNERLLDIYIDQTKLEYQTNRYINALEKFEGIFGTEDVEIYSAPGRTEVGGNHTDHQHGEVLAASINDDAIAVVAKTDDDTLQIFSEGYDMITIPINSTNEVIEADKGTTKAIISGVVHGMVEHGHKVGGFKAYITSDVLGGSGLSSSAAFETIIGTILSGLYNDMSVSAIEIAIIGQYAENVYFGKPCGLMDQMACSVGSLCHIDFKNPADPIVERVDFDIDAQGYSLCITDTRGSHADLTPDYAAVPAEMKSVAKEFGKEVLRDVDEAEVLKNLPMLRDKLGDRAVLRALHFYEEDKRVEAEVEALKTGSFKSFLFTVALSGDSSYKYLQNVYPSHDVNRQNVSIALCISDMVLGKGHEKKGVSRVHGGGFAGTMQAFVQNDAVEEYKKAMDDVFGEGACMVLKIRKYGGMKVL